jgi:ubiquinol-cytochrome c reductase cytochrome b subunit
MAGGNRQKLDNPVMEWIDSRLPVFTLMQKEYGVFPTPKNFNYFWNFGAIAMVMLIIMILTGIVLAMHYTPHADMAFNSVERIMRDVNHGWLLRYLHANGASFFFIAVYIHIFRGMYYGSYKQPRELLWILGVLIFLLMMATAFMGYVLPWGQMSFWGATVITNLFSAIPLVGDSIVTLLWGGFSVDNPTLNRFFALHYLLPFVIFAVVFLHVWALHVTGSNNPLGIEPKGKQDTLPFHPYYTMKDTFGLLVFLIVYALFTFFMPNALGHPDNYIPADPLVTPAHIVPEWYFLPFYAILRAITFDIGSFIMGSGLFALGLAAIFTPKQYKTKFLGRIEKGFESQFGFPSSAMYMVAGIVMALIGAELLYSYFINDRNIIFLPAKLGGVLAMFGSIALLFILPFLDKHPIRSAVFRPWYRIALLIFVAVVVVLGVCGGKPAEGLWVPLAQICTLYYYGFFLVIIPFLNKKEPVAVLPPSINDAVLLKNKKSSKTVATIILALIIIMPANVYAAEEAAAPPEQDWSFEGPFGTYDRGALQRGFQVYSQVCSACHSMKLLSYRNLRDLGYSEAQVKAIASQYTMTDGPNDEGEMFERPGKPSDRFVSPYPNDNAARYANNGALPPDLSLIAKARVHGPDYIYGILTGYEEAPEGETLAQGQYWNKYMPGHKIAMAPPLSDGVVAYEDGSDNTVRQYAKDVSAFLMWAAEPKLEVRKRTGIKVILFLLVFAGLMYAVKRKIWADVKH